MEDQTKIDRVPELVAHLSKEIDTQTRSIMDFRTRSNFTIYVGPFIILGTYLFVSKGSSFQYKFGWCEYALLSGLALCWLAIGFGAAIIEKHVWDKCNDWRRLIHRLLTSPNVNVSEEELVFEHQLTAAYFRVYGILLVAFVLSVWLLARIPSNEEMAVTKPQTHEASIVPPDSSRPR